MTLARYWTCSCKLGEIPITQAAITFLERLSVKCDVPDVIHTDKLWSYGAAIRALPVLHSVNHVQVILTAHCNHLIEQSHRPTRQQERSQSGFNNYRRAQEFFALHARIYKLQQHTRTTVPTYLRMINQNCAHLAWQTAVEVAVWSSDGRRP